ncbi:MAG: cyclase family protein [Isosphaeraceae bacterium]
MSRIFDISPPITPELAVWPGDSPFQREVLLDIARGDSVTLSTLHATVHLGAHADGLCHVAEGRLGIDAIPLDLFLGPCQVIRIDVPAGTRIELAHLGVPITETRILLCTNTYPDPNRFETDFAALAPALVDYLHDRGVRLIGIDTPSVDLFESPDLPAHQRCVAHDMAILEGLVLGHVPTGRYELVALPLRLVGFDASPVRAILRSLA